MRANLFVGVIVFTFTVFWCATDAKTLFLHSNRSTLKQLICKSSDTKRTWVYWFSELYKTDESLHNPVRVTWIPHNTLYVEDRDLFRTTPSDSLLRVKRQQTPDPTDQFFNNVFQIPISTLNAVNELIKSTRPVIRRARERIQQQYQTWQQQNGSNGNRVKPGGRDASE